MKSIDYRNDPLFLRNMFFMTGEFDLPFLYRQSVSLDNLDFISFDHARNPTNVESAAKKTVHFFIDDYKFDEVWNNPDQYVVKLAEYFQVLTPDFSLYTNMPTPLQLMSVFKSRWCGAFWQRNGLRVIPTVNWGKPSSFAFCFDGIEEGAVVAVSTVGTSDFREEFMEGYRAMCEQIHPETVVNYGTVYDEMLELAPVVDVPYIHWSES